MNEKPKCKPCCSTPNANRHTNLCLKHMYVVYVTIDSLNHEIMKLASLSICEKNTKSERLRPQIKLNGLCTMTWVDTFFKPFKLAFYRA